MVGTEDAVTVAVDSDLMDVNVGTGEAFRVHEGLAEPGLPRSRKRDRREAGESVGREGMGTGRPCRMPVRC